MSNESNKRAGHFIRRLWGFVMAGFLGFAIHFGLAFVNPTVAWASIGEVLDEIPIQDGGRIKPFGTFAKESLQLIYGKSTFEGKNAAEIVFTWALIPEHWAQEPIIELRHKGLKEALKITSTDRYYSEQSLFSNPHLQLIFQELQGLHTKGEKLNPYFQAVQRLENQLSLFQGIRSGRALHFAPDPGGNNWKPATEMDDDLRDSFARITKAFVSSISGGGHEATLDLKEAVNEFIAKAQAKAPDRYADMSRIGWELHLNRFHPFRWAWISYLLSLICLFAMVNFGVKKVNLFSWLFLWAGFGLHFYGMALRVYLAGRPPVSNMYETVVWVPFGCVLFSLILYHFQKNRMLVGAASVIAVLCLNLSDLAPTVLDSSLQPLEPVLRSTFWLSTHVLIIAISYAAFFLAFALGDLVLYYYLRGEEKHAQAIRSATLSIYRAIQIGVVLLAFGIILGGIWADYSWGRFWGWDPKETWALIALLGYLALLHGRLVGWVKNFQLAAGSVVAFSLVIMAWYGVNMVLGAGLHTYGFGAGGVEYVTAFVVAHLLFVTYVSALRYPIGKKSSN